MVDSRLRIPLPRLFECFIEVTAPDPEAKLGPQVKRFYPESFEEKKELISQIPTFCFPCTTDSPGVQYFTFVLTDIDGKFRFGFCRYPAHAPLCICIVSYAPWFEMFYRVLNNISDAEIRGENDFVIPLLNELHAASIPDLGSSFSLTANYLSTSKVFKYDVPDTTKLPTIPESRNLTEYFAAITPEIMVQLFISMLFERRILVTSKKLSLVTAIVHGSVSLLYPMQWQHIFVPVLPPKLLDYCCAPMPFLLGIHSSMMNTVKRMPLDEVVILDADQNEITSPFDDMKVFPQEVSSKLLSKLKKTERALDDYVASQFIRALVKVIGGYRDSLKFKETEDSEGGKIVFDEEAFISSRSSSIRPFLEQILHLQSFMQFIAGRLDLLNAGIEFGDVFEQEILHEGGDHSKWRSQYQQWTSKMKKSGGLIKKTVGIQYAFLKGKANDMELKGKVKAIYKGAKSGMKTGYKGAKHQLKGAKHTIKGMKLQMKSKDIHDGLPGHPVKRTESYPSSHLANLKETPFRHSMYSTLPSSRIQHGLRRIPKPGTPPPRPPRSESDMRTIAKSASTDCINSSSFDNEAEKSEEEVKHETLLQMADTHSEPSIANLIDLESISLQENSNRSQSQDISGHENLNFVDEQFYVIDDEDILEHKGLNVSEISRNSNSSWVTFDDDDDHVKQDTEVKQASVSSPAVEIKYEDLIRAVSEQDQFVVVSSDQNISESRLEDLLQTDHNSATECTTPSPASSTRSDFSLQGSCLLSDTLSSVSPETRSLFTKSDVSSTVTCTVSSQMQANSPSNQRKTRRPPPRPPLPGSTPSHVQQPPRVPAHPLIPTPSSDKKCLNPVTKDPFADLMLETKNSLYLNQNPK